jgi:pilus assembly protein CpaC
VNWGQLEFLNDGTVRFVDQPWLIRAERGVDNVLDFGAQVEALTSQNYAQVLSEPNLLVDDGGEAEIQVGGEIPVPISQPGGGGVSTVTVEWKPFGVLLKIQPTILEDGEKINLKLSPEVSSLDFGNAVTLGGFVIPALRKRTATTVVTMADGNTLVIGGLLQTDDVSTVRAIPLLSKIPIIGELFKRREKQRTESELIISVTPEIVRELE